MYLKNVFRCACKLRPAGAGHRYNPSMPPRKPQDPDSVEADALAEAERLALLQPDQQRGIIALHRSVANNPKVPKADRELARRRADLLTKFLRQLNRKKP